MNGGVLGPALTNPSLSPRVNGGVLGPALTNPSISPRVNGGVLVGSNSLPSRARTRRLPLGHVKSLGDVTEVGMIVKWVKHYDRT